MKLNIAPTINNQWITLNRTRLELKRQKVIENARGQYSLNRTRLELKLLEGAHIVEVVHALNRTRLELKQSIDFLERLIPHTLNRTRLELKLRLLNSGLDAFQRLIAPDWN